jgi:hypothetical protein
MPMKRVVNGEVVAQGNSCVLPTNYLQKIKNVLLAGFLNVQDILVGVG